MELTEDKLEYTRHSESNQEMATGSRAGPKQAKESHKATDPLMNPNPNAEVQVIRLEKEVRRLRRENKRFIQEINKLNDLIEQMKNIDDDELLMIEKIQTKEIYGKAQKMKISEIQKETEKIRIEIDRLRVINKNKDRQMDQKDAQVRDLRSQVERLKSKPAQDRVVYKTEYKEDPRSRQRIQELESEIRRLQSMPAKIQTVSAA